MDFSAGAYEAVHSRLRARFGHPVEAWWRALPAVVAELSDRWALSVGGPVGRGNTSVLLRCRRSDGSAGMLKLTPETDLALAEATSLSAWAASGRVPALWARDTRLGALLLEALPREAPLSECARHVSSSELVALIEALHRAGEPAVGHGVVSLADRVEFIFELWIGRHSGRSEVTDVVPLTRLRQGQKLARRLVSEAGAPVLLHGDLHPGNVLDGGQSRGLVAIDPRPCVGDAAFDVVDWVFWDADSSQWEARSHELASALGLEQDRVWAWCSALAAMFAAGKVTGAGAPNEVGALLALAV